MRRSAILLVAALLILAACTAPQPTNQPPTATSMPPTFTAEAASAPPSPTSAATRESTSAAPTIEPTDESRPGPRLFGAEHLYGSGPAIPHGPEGAWDAAHTYPGAVVYHEGVFYLYRKGWAVDDLGLGAVGLSTSAGR